VIILLGIHNSAASKIAFPRYHCPIIGFLNIPKISQKTSKRKIWLYDRGDYDKFKLYSSDVDWDSLISSNNVNNLTTNVHIISHEHIY
jgi:hypothetical protein